MLAQQFTREPEETSVKRTITNISVWTLDIPSNAICGEASILMPVAPLRYQVYCGIGSSCLYRDVGQACHQYIQRMLLYDGVPATQPAGHLPVVCASDENDQAMGMPRFTSLQYYCISFPSVHRIYHFVHKSTTWSKFLFPSTLSTLVFMGCERSQGRYPGFVFVSTETYLVTYCGRPHAVNLVTRHQFLNISGYHRILKLATRR